jgi:hypothetical protein
MTLISFNRTYGTVSPYGTQYPIGIVNDIDVQASTLTDKDIRKIDASFPSPTPENIEWAFWNENTSQSWGYVTVAMTCGEGFPVACKKKSRKEEAEKIIARFNADINWQHQSIYDYIRDHWFDNMIHHYSLWRVARDKNRPTGIEIGRVDPLSLTEVPEPVHGYKMYIQQAKKWSQEWKTPEAFYKNYNPANPPSEENVWVKIPVDPQVCLYISHFHQAPAKSALKYMVTKLWILYFMRKFAEKHWAPLILGLIGEPGKYIPNKKEMATVAENLKTLFENIHSFSSATLPGYVRIETVQPSSSGKAGAIYMDAIDMLDRQIMFTLMASMAMREASGRDLSTQRGIKELWELVIKGFRRDIEKALLTFYAEVLLPENGIDNVEPDELEILWPEIQVLPPIVEMTQAMDVAAKDGLIKYEEARAYLRQGMKGLDKANDSGDYKFYEPPVANTFGNKTKPKASNSGTKARAGTPAKKGS